MRKGRLGWLAIGLMVLGVLMTKTMTTQAAAGTEGVQAVRVSVVPVINKYQVNKNTGFYDLEMQPGQKTELAMRLINNDTKPVTLNVQTTAASTSMMGQIQYSDVKQTYDPTLAHPLPNLVTIPKKYQKITIPAAKIATYHLPLTMPKQAFNGIILGAVRVQPDTKNTKKAGITNTYAYSVAVRLSNGKSTLPDLKMPSVTTSSESGETHVEPKFQNPKAAMLRNGTLDMRVTKQGQNRTLKSMQLNQSSVAPNSNFKARIPWNGAIAPGDYTMHATYTSTDPAFAAKKVWHFTRNFHVSTFQAAQYTLASMHIPWWVYVILVVILLLLIVIIVLLLKRKKKGADSSEKS